MFDHRSDETKVVEKEGNGTHDRFRFHNHVPLNASNAEFRVHFLEVCETRLGTKKHPEPKTMHVSWGTDLLLDETNLMKIRSVPMEH